MTARRDILLICGGKYHDIDFARLELLKLLAEAPHRRVRVREDYSDTDAIARADALITYTCEMLPDEAAQDALDAFLNSRKRWFALHGTNSRLKYVKGTGWTAPNDAPRFMEMLGSQFVAHPPIQPFTVRPSRRHPLVDGIEPFEADDEIYLCRFFGEHECLLETQYTGMAEGFEEDDWRDNERVPVMYLRDWGNGSVLYLNLGHARGRYDMQPLMDEYPEVERGSWKQPAFYELLRRGIDWAVDEPPRQAA
ncbi:MAG: ThuA domain-containing protein [Woeseiaceae bacterium]|nr:ThuA domain-containing protein [Woeseiaceae bacterium]